jgi:phenylalanyl-tRNA synthetase beta chain
VKLPISWLREFVEVPDDPVGVARRLAGCGFAVESIEDDVVDFEVTANRPDCLSVYGLAREAAAVFGLPLAPPPGGRLAPSGPTPVAVDIEAPDCGRYALAIADVTIGPSSAWMASRLLAAGVRPVNNVVDVTNYVMLEIGHPMHAFDAGRIAGSRLRIRLARPGERLTTLDGESRTLDASMLVIADRDDAVAIAGVMGGAGSEVSAETTRIALESAWFTPRSVRATSRTLGLKTEASARFERGADIAAPVTALLRALELFEAIGAGRPAGGIVDVWPAVPNRTAVRLRTARVAALLGQAVPDREIQGIVERLGFRLSLADDGFSVDVPSFRVDVAREADLIEEVGRHWGFDRIPATLPPLREAPPAVEAGAAFASRLAALARSAGLQEAVTFTFIDRGAAEPFTPSGGRLVDIANPLSEKFAVLRPSLLPGLVDALVYNRRRESDDVRLFEVGSVFHREGELTGVGWVLTGSRGNHWSGGIGALDFFDAKGVAELLAQAAGVEPDRLRWTSDDAPTWFVRGRAARVSIDAGGTLTPLGTVGEVRPDIIRSRGLDTGVVVAGEIDTRVLASIGPATSATISPIPRYPSIVRDLSIVVSERLPAADVRDTIRSNAPPTLATVGEFDRYQGQGVPDGHVSLSVRLTFRHPDRTLTDGDVQQAVDAIVRSLADRHGAVLRGA